MADSNIAGNVENPLVQLVVESSTTGVDDNTHPAQVNASGDSDSAIIVTAPREDLSEENTKNNKTTSFSSSGQDGADGENTASGADLESNGKVTDTVQIGESISRSGSISPTKSDTNKPLDRKPSTKKPSFKPVSLNKQFLKESPTPGPSSSLSSGLSAAKVLDKGTTGFSNIQQPTPRSITTSKLKLVKTGGLVQSARPGSTGPSGSSNTKRAEQTQPVWNKNQPVPPVPAKDFTDEELKKQYGIHLASRLGADDAGSKEAKWADIDDDDDDWVPETIEWNDGMKVSLNEPVEEETTAPPPPPPEIPQLALVAEPTTSETKETPPAPIKQESNRPKTLVTEKPGSKIVEPVSPRLSRASPWAKVSVPNVPTPPITNPVPPRNVDLPRRQDARIESPVPPFKEVPTDAYDRSWRDRNANPAPRERELFNSETGQLEPVQEGQNRGPRPRRSDAQLNMPAVLQRPVGPPQQAGPAEPSAAFQQHRSSIYHRPEEYRRRRTSSNVSGGSGSIGRRPSFSRFGGDQPPTPEDMAFPSNRQGPPSHGSALEDTPSRDNHRAPPYSPVQQHIAPLPQPEPSPKIPSASLVTSVAQPVVVENVQQAQIPEAPVLEADFEDPVVKQERIMREGRELARKRRQEEEAKEELAKKERLRIKLEMLEKMATEKAEKEAAERKAAEEKIAAEKAAKEKKLAEERAAAEKVAAAQRIAEDKAAERREAEERLAATERLSRQGQGSYPDRYVRPPIRPQSPTSIPTSIPTAPQSRRQSISMQQRPHHNKQFTAPGNRDAKEQPWKNVPPGNDRFTSWGSNNSPANSSPWGAIGEKPRANGTGNGSLDRYNGSTNRSPPGPSSQQDRQGRLPPTSPELNRNRWSPQASQDQRERTANPWASFAANVQDDEAVERDKGREIRLARAAEEAAAGTKPAEPVRSNIVETWRKVRVNGAADASLVSKNTREISVDRKAPTVNPPQTHPPAPHPQSIPPHQQNIPPHLQNIPPHLRDVPPHLRDVPPHQQNIPSGPAAGRPASRFFPSTAGDLIAQHLGSPSRSRDAPRTPSPASPPPPMSSDHPVHGDAKSPVAHVHLPPPTHPQPVGGRISPGPRVNGHSRIENPRSPRAFSSGFDAFEAVQQKILVMTQKHSPPQQPARLQQVQHSHQGHPAHPTHPAQQTHQAQPVQPAQPAQQVQPVQPTQQTQPQTQPQSQNPKAVGAFSSTKPSFEAASPEKVSKPVTVSLPGQSDSGELDGSNLGFRQEDSGCVLSKPDDEEFFHDLFKQDFGSTPTVKIPHQAPQLYATNKASKAATIVNRVQKKTNQNRVMQSMDVFNAFTNKDFINNDGKKFIPVNIPGTIHMEVVVRKTKKSYSPRNKPQSRYNSGGNSSHINRNGASGRKLAEAV